MAQTFYVNIIKSIRSTDFPELEKSDGTFYLSKEDAEKTRRAYERTVELVALSTKEYNEDVKE